MSAKDNFKEKLKREGFVIENKRVVCNTCKGNCGQCGISIRMAALNKEFIDLVNKKEISYVEDKIEAIDNTTSIFNFMLTIISILCILSIIYVLFT
jgi:hypothetical protein